MLSKSVVTFFLDFGTYLFTLIGLILSDEFREYEQTGSVSGIDIPDLPTLVVGGAVGFIALYLFDHGGEADIRRKRFPKRAAFALGLGLMGRVLASFVLDMLKVMVGV